MFIIIIIIFLLFFSLADCGVAAAEAVYGVHSMSIWILSGCRTGISCESSFVEEEKEEVISSINPPQPIPEERER
ncbi:hypothetical protein EX30DRAFT_340506 [Ascodesmis nigricans]|uniref:Secreted protein n=1 Tax=Ascodesmis nigricans TaxID=341454 RepID=A0A4S2MY49_9PEZI|nr:hypothetical protein EX30DRAFT_340506 [Ascodesmis nigricans]